MPLQHGRCFYCRRDLHRSVEVDHFVPWSRYPHDLAHNFVLAHRGCNGAKSDFLAWDEHLANWVQRNETYGEELGREYDGAGVLHDLAGTRRVAIWAYGQTERAGGQVWVQGKELRPLGAGWREILAPGWEWGRGGWHGGTSSAGPEAEEEPRAADE